jgi:hypothetical protein
MSNAFFLGGANRPQERYMRNIRISGKIINLYRTSAYILGVSDAAIF